MRLWRHYTRTSGLRCSSPAKVHGEGQVRMPEQAALEEALPGVHAVHQPVQAKQILVPPRVVPRVVLSRACHQLADLGLAILGIRMGRLPFREPAPSPGRQRQRLEHAQEGIGVVPSPRHVTNPELVRLRLVTPAVPEVEELEPRREHSCGRSEVREHGRPTPSPICWSC